jgi:hypothetical protein
VPGPLVTLFVYLRNAGRLGPYAKLLLWRHRRILGYSILVAGIALSLTMVERQSTHFNNLLVQTSIEGRKASCARDVSLTKNIRAIIDGTKAVAKVQHDKHLTTDAQYGRALDFYNDALGKLPIPDCVSYVEDYKRQIADHR